MAKKTKEIPMSQHWVAVCSVGDIFEIKKLCGLFGATTNNELIFDEENSQIKISCFVAEDKSEKFLARAYKITC